ncbi:hypothetical protein FGM00_09680 [Aggregatimonas sangjinii]|uniref:Uncharacterized protein n=1 Tax=Aggregatimonas sangjinii TaxID=2583587 RepID=A0A5B7SST0_9FLAO|nr:hypothetical protein [Aggregatimonas sangjinii]QCX00369.1 hypothetical protein FGM00_09680 [Aggregatimonas sangjinii]
MKESNKNNPFTTPEGYFENFTDRLMDQLSQESPELPKEEGFIVPEDYFDGVYKNVQHQLATKETKVVQLHPYRKFYFAAASIAAVAVLVFALNWNASEELTFESLAESEIENYFETNEYDLSAYELAEVIPLDGLDIDDMLTNRFEEENVIDYLDENIEDFEELNLEDYE